ncbi:hypothetical protein [Polaromonas sp. AET17H-212]|uniref:hypothetical protein n=1 Tax=Polaromonas sp. AET17H-212 TaxID=1977061 RepID=UPI00114134BA|nr:hypothetical protein [Polaromonas sp. AET17H-212]
MALEKRILLARPHAFIVSEMRPFLVETGYSPVRVESLSQLSQELRGSLNGAILSTAVTSSVDADVATVFRLIRQAHPHLPVVFAGMASFDTMKVITERAVHGLVSAPTISSPRDYRAVSASTRSSSFLVLRKEDLQPGDSHSAAIKALRAYFS